MNPDEKLPTPEQILGLLADCMPTRDLENLRYILQLGPERSLEWLQTQDPDDAVYALELIATCTAELRAKIQALEEDDEDLDLTEANLVINRIKGTL
jgi:hypothetical protein